MNGTVTRLFSINITFHQQIYTALVNIRQVGIDVCCDVRYIDKDLNFLAQGDSLTFSLTEDSKEPDHHPYSLKEDLVDCTNKAIANYLHLKTT